jgi:hypothetical protein
MLAPLATAAVSLWLAAFLCQPRRPRAGCEEMERVYFRLLGQRDRLIVIAIALTLVAFVAGVIGMAGAANDDLALLRNPCGDAGNRGSWCWSLDSDNRWIRKDFR